MAEMNTGNFINPDYSTPEQAAQLRAYANALQGAAIAPTAKSWTGVLANALMGYQGQSKTDQANQLTRQIAQQSSNELNGNTNPLVSALIHGLPPGGQQMPQQGPQGIPQRGPAMIPPQQGAAGPADVPAGVPMPPGQNLTGPNTSITGIEYGPVTGNPSFSGSPTSGAGAPMAQALMQKPTQMAQNGSLAPILSSPSIPAEVKAQILQGGMPKGGLDVYGNPIVGTTMGGLRSTEVGPGVSTGIKVPANVSSNGTSVGTEIIQSAPRGGQVGGLQGAIAPLMDTAKSVGELGAGNKATQDVISQDTATAANAIPIRQTLAAMRDDIKSHGDKMVFGPSAPWLTELKRGIAQHAPGLMSESDIAGLASADSFDKLTAQLQSIVGRQVGGTDASLLQGMKSVPGSHNSKEGALALIDMLDQTAKQSAQFVAQNQYKLGQPGFNYLAEKNKFFEQNPIINPISGHALRVDLTSKGNQPAAATSGGGWGIKR